MKRVINYEDYLNKINGCWLGKSIAGVIGAPFEDQKIFEELSWEKLWPKEIYPNDDLDIQIIWLEMLEEIGCDFTSCDIADYWLDRCWYSFSEYGYFINNYQKGIDPPLSGKFNNNYFRESEGCPIRAEIWGMVCPGNPKMAAEFAKMDGQLDHIDNSIWAEMFWAACNAEAFVSDDLEEIVNCGLSVIPQDSDIAQIVYDVFVVLENCDSLKEMWITLIRTWGDRDASKSKINFAFSLLSLLYGERDFKRTMECACSLTWDTDCTAGTACALLGTIIGANNIPQDWLDKMGQTLTCDVNSYHKGQSFVEFSKDTALVGIENMINKNNLIDILDIPEDEYIKASDRYYSREPLEPLSLSISYEVADNVPSLIEGSGTCELVIKNNTNKLINGLVRFEAEDNKNLNVLAVENMSNSIEFEVDANSEEKILVSVNVNDDQDIIWQNNLIEAIVETEEETYHKFFGFAGSNHWNVYGPYWDVFDKKRFKENPYRNDDLSLNSHPHRKSEAYMMNHQYVDINKEYLNESLLLKEEILEEYPFKVECPEFLMTNKDISNNMGETCYYFTRTIVPYEDYKAKVHIGITGPFIVWLDGEEFMKGEGIGTWCPDEYYCDIDFEEGREYRFVIKALQKTDEFKFSFDFIMADYPESKEYGKSIFLDNYGDKIN